MLFIGEGYLGEFWGGFSQSRNKAVGKTEKERKGEKLNGQEVARQQGGFKRLSGVHCLRGGGEHNQ